MDKTIIKNIKSFFFNSYLNKLIFLDPQIVKEIKSTEVNLTKKQKSHIVKILKLLNLYFALNDININYLSFKNSNQDNLFNDFLLFITSNLTNTKSGSIKSKQAYQNYLNLIVEQLNKSRVSKIELKKIETFDHKYDFSSYLNKIKVVDGVKIIKSNDKIVVSSIEYANRFGIDKCLEIYNQLELMKNHSKLNRGSLDILSMYLRFISEKGVEIYESNEKILSEFIFIYFKDLEDRKVNILNYKQFWNNFISVIKDVFNLDINEKQLRVKTEHRNGNSANIKVVNKKFVKDKLLTEVPLEVCDDKAMFVLKEKSIQDIEIIKNWAQYTLEDYEKQQKIGNYPHKEFFTVDPEVLRVKYKMWQSKGFKYWVEENLNTNAIFNKSHLFAAASLLVINNPSITESFLKDLTRSSVVKTDQGTYLIGRKHRKGKNFSEQKILLNKESLKVINILIENSKKMSEIIESDSLLLHVTKWSQFKILEAKTFKITKDVFESINNYLSKKYNFEKEMTESFIKKINLTRIRATCGINTFFKYENTKKMAEILGHEVYNSKLLTHYLPEPIIHFYQSRWIRIFQKGIIYEAMKYNENLLSSIGFENMDILDEFLKNHTIKNLPTTNNHFVEGNEMVEKETVFDECYVTISEDNLIALLSIKEAVEVSENKSKINEKALFWKNFTERLINEIENNNSYFSFNKILLNAKEKINNNLEQYKKVIYA